MSRLPGGAQLPPYQFISTSSPAHLCSPQLQQRTGSRHVASRAAAPFQQFFLAVCKRPPSLRPLDLLDYFFSCGRQGTE